VFSELAKKGYLIPKSVLKGRSTVPCQLPLSPMVIFAVGVEHALIILGRGACPFSKNFYCPRVLVVGEYYPGGE
jgi:hypothetical protein